MAAFTPKHHVNMESRRFDGPSTKAVFEFEQHEAELLASRPQLAHSDLYLVQDVWQHFLGKHLK